MTSPYLRGALLGALALGMPLAAQTTLPGGVVSISPTILQVTTSTTGMVGLTVNQTARLNVLNLNPTIAVASLTPPANCTVELAFYDNKGVQINQTVVSNFAPGTATSLDLPRATVTSESAVRAEIRGVVTVNPTSGVLSGIPTPTPAGSTTTVGYCTVMTTLEVFDANGSTVSSTSDTRTVGFSSLASLLTVIK